MNTKNIENYFLNFRAVKQFWMVFVGWGIFLTMNIDRTFGQSDIEEFLEWPETTNYSFVIISILVMIAFGIIGNYLWSKRKGRRYSEE